MTVFEEAVAAVSAPVLVTGATGYLAGWVVRGLLERGVQVRATVRDPENAAKVQHLWDMAEALPGDLTLHRADLLEEGSFDAAMVGCGIVIHTASPFTSAVTDPQRDLVDPAVKGTRNVLGAVNRTQSVQRVVLTSSCAAIYGDARDLLQVPGGVLREDQWNSTSSLTRQPYSYSKTLAERAAWEVAEAQDRWRLVAINPSLILGPGTADSQTSESFAIFRQLGAGAMKAGVPPLEIGAVDVRDVAEAHVRAAFLPQAEGRHIVSARSVSLLELAQMVHNAFGDGVPVGLRELPKWLLWLVGPIMSKTLTRDMVRNSMGYSWKADNGKSREALGLRYRSLEAAVAEMYGQMIATGQVPAP